MRFAQRTGWDAETNPLSQMKISLEKEGVKLFDLTASNPTRCQFDYPNLFDLQELTRDQNKFYEPDSHGLLEARKAAREYYRKQGIAVELEQIFLTASTSEAYAFLFRLLLDAGDAVAVPEPSYPLLNYLAALNDVEVERYAFSYSGEGWRVAASQVEVSIQRSKALIVIHPNNPTGNYWNEKDSLNHFCRKRDMAVISDEVFFDFSWNTKNQTSFAGNQDVLTFTLNGISKLLGMPQMKLSWIVVSGPPDERRKAIRRLEVIADTYLSVNTPVQRALPAWLQQKDAVHAEINKRLRQNYDYLCTVMEKSKIAKVLNVEGGWYAVLKILSEEEDEIFALRLLREKHVFVHPGFFYDFPDGKHIVLSLLPDTQTFSLGVDRIA